MKNVLVLIEGEEGHICEDSKSVLQAARKLADEKGGTLIGTAYRESFSKAELNTSGINEFYELPLGMNEDSCGQLAGLQLAEIAKNKESGLILAVNNLLGESALGTAAALLDGAFFNSCREISYNNNTFNIHRVICNGKVDEILTASNPNKYYLATLIPSGTGRNRVSSRGKITESEQIIELIKRATPTIIEEFKADPGEIDLTEAELVVAMGAGVSTPEGYQLVADFASKIGASLGGSRIAVDRGFLPHKRLVGLTGNVVAPKLYIGIGISGAPHHLNGIRDAKIIIAINKDANAPLLKAADIAVVGDAFTILPALIEELGGNK